MDTFLKNPRAEKCLEKIRTWKLPLPFQMPMVWVMIVGNDTSSCRVKTHQVMTPASCTYR